MLLLRLLSRARQLVTTGVQQLQDQLRSWSTPPRPSLTLGLICDLVRTKPQLVLENALLRQQLIVLNRSVKRPYFTPADRGRLIVLASRLPSWRETLLIVKPETLLRWHRAGFRRFWKWKSRTTIRESKLAPETIALIKELATNNRLWGADRIRGELLKLGINVAKRTIQRSMRHGHPSRPRGQTWATFLHNHANDIWACDFLQVTDLYFRPLFAFFIMELGSRRIVHVGVTRTPTDQWVAQQLREATPFGVAPNYLIGDNDGKYGSHVAAVAAGTGIELLRTLGTLWVKAPRANAVCERVLGSVRRECLDHILVVGEAHLWRVLSAYVRYFNRSRPHQGIAQRIPEAEVNAGAIGSTTGKVRAFPVLGGLHHDERRVA
jgi:hypothetical protein